MKALVFDGPGSASIRDVEHPRPAPDEVLVRPTRVGICHSDLGLLSGDYILPIPWPVVPGHEWTGIVEEVGEATEGLSVGDHVVGECAVAADTHVGFTIDGAAAESMVAKGAWLHRLPDGFDPVLGALVEPFTVGFAATKGVDAADDVVVLGGGPIGLCAVAAAKGRGARVILVDPHRSRRTLASSLGADVVIDAGGNGGTIVALGISVGDVVPAELGLIMGKALTVRGQVGSAGVWPDAIRFLDRVGIDLSALVSEVHPLDDAHAALEAAARKDTIKVHLSLGGAHA
jgi:threonine dehydrogenase-like Zn-dependent dehydrogenase